MRATSSVLSYCILHAIQAVLKTKDLTELLKEELGRNSLLLKKLLCGFSREAGLAEYYPAAMAQLLYSHKHVTGTRV